MGDDKCFFEALGDLGAAVGLGGDPSVSEPECGEGEDLRCFTPLFRIRGGILMRFVISQKVFAMSN